MPKRFKELYKTEIAPSLAKTFAYKNIHQVPKISKIVVNMGVSDAVSDSKAVVKACNDLALIVGQKPVITVAKESIAAFKLRKGMKLGCKVTLRRRRAYDFLERLIIMALPRVKEFRGFSKKSFDGHGNFSFGLKEHSVFSEVNYDSMDKARGMDITVVTTAPTDIEGKSLLSALMFPFYD